MSDVALGRFNRALEKFFNAKGGPTTVDVGPSILPITSIDGPADQRYLQQWNRFGGAINSGSGAANNAGVQLRNPKGSNVIAVVEKIFVVLLTATTRSGGILSNGVTVDLSTIVTPTPMDARQISTSGSVMILSTQANVGAGPTIAVWAVSNGLGMDLIQTIDQEIAVLPGDGLQLRDTTQNEAITGAFMWRERALESSELT